MSDKASATNSQKSLEASLFEAADALRMNLEPSEYKHIALGLIFLRHVSYRFDQRHAELVAEDPELAEDPDEYSAENIFWIPPAARWSRLRNNARSPDIGKLIDSSMTAIENENPALTGVLNKTYNRPTLDKVMLGRLVDLISDIKLADADGTGGDVLGRVYEYFLGGFAGSEGRRGGEFYTPRSVVRLLVDMLEPFPDPGRGVDGRVYDPCCGSGGMFVQAERFLEAHGGRIGQLALYGQESNHTTWRLCKMNLAVRGIDASGIAWNNEGTFRNNEWRDKRFDFILANPPFNVSDWIGAAKDRKSATNQNNVTYRDDVRWTFGVPPAGNANYAWLQHIHHHLAPNGMAGVVLANGSMSSGQSGEGDIRRAMVEADVVDCMIALPGQLFYSTQIPACLWFLARNKTPGGGWRDRRGAVLFIDARTLGHMVDRTRRAFSDADIARIAAAYRAWRGAPDAPAYADEPGFCRAATLEEIAAHNHVLTPGRYVGAAAAAADETPFAERFAALRQTLDAQFAEGRDLERDIVTRLALVEPPP